MKSTIDKLFYNGTIYTLASEGDTVESLGVSAGKIVHAGSKNLAEMNYDIKEYVDDGQIPLPSVADCIFTSRIPPNAYNRGSGGQ